MKFCSRKFNVFLLTATASMAVQYMMTLSSTVIAGNLLGTKALSAVNLVSSPSSFMLFISMLLGLGASILYTSAMGRFEEKRASNIFGCGLLASLISGFFFSIVFYFLQDVFLNFMKADSETLAFAAEYWKYFLLIALIQPIATYLMSMVYCDGDGLLSFFCYVVQLAVNCGFSYIFCKRIGIGGCALGIFLSNLAAIFVLSLHFFKKKNSIHFPWHWSWRDIFLMCRSSFGDASVMLCWALFYFVLNKFIISHFGSDKLPVVAAIIAASGFTMVFDGLGNGIQPLIGVYSGEKNYPSIRNTMKTAGIAAFIEGACLTIVILLFPGIVLKLTGITDPEISTITRIVARIMAPTYFFSAFVFLFNSYYLFIEREFISCVLTFLKDLICPIAMIVIGGTFFGFYGVWIAYSLAAPTGIALFSLILLIKFGRKMYPLLLPRNRDAQIWIWDICLDNAQKICHTAEEISAILRQRGTDEQTCAHASLLTEEMLMAIRDYNQGKSIYAELTLDTNDGISLVFRDDGTIFDITNCDAKISSLRSYLVSSIMIVHKNKKNLTTTGFNRNIFKF